MQKFSEYFNNWLSTYYKNPLAVGAKGDFVTSVTTSGFFGATIAHYFLQRVKSGFFHLDKIWFVEFGANRGLALSDIIRYIAGEDIKLLKNLRFCAVEPFAKEALKKALKEFEPHVKELKIVDSFLDLNCNEAFVFANEVLDCQPCELLYKNKFATVKNNKIEFDFQDENLLEIANKFNITKGEIPLTNFCNTFKDIKCEAVFFDYGQNYARNDFSIRIYKNHQTTPFFAINNLLEFENSSDITYDVNFEIWSDAFLQHGFAVDRIKNQSKALIDFGLDKLMQKLLEISNEKAIISEMSKIKMLLAPDGFGERFKMLRIERT